MVQLKTCTKCGGEKELSEFHRKNSNKDGFSSQCKECQSAYRKKHYEANKEKVKAQSRIWYGANKERKHEAGKEWIKNNHERHLEIHRRCRKNNHEEHLNCVKSWRKNNPDKHSIIRNRHHAKRRRNFGFIPLNEKFPGSVGHHISKDLVIFIPEELHNSVPHRYNDPISMGEINGLALEFMLPEIG